MTTKAQNINIDAGCVYSNTEGYSRLTALELYSYNFFQFKNLFTFEQQIRNSRIANQKLDYEEA